MNKAIRFVLAALITFFALVSFLWTWLAFIFAAIVGFWFVEHPWSVMHILTLPVRIVYIVLIGLVVGPFAMVRFLPAVLFAVVLPLALGALLFWMLPWYISALAAIGLLWYAGRDYLNRVDQLFVWASRGSMVKWAIERIDASERGFRSAIDEACRSLS